MITQDMLIGEILEQKEGAAAVLMANGMGCLGCPSSQMESLSQAADIHGLDIKALIEELNK